MPQMSLSWTNFADNQRPLVVVGSNGTRESLCGFAGRSIGKGLPCSTCQDLIFRTHDDAIQVTL